MTANDETAVGPTKSTIIPIPGSREISGDGSRPKEKPFSLDQLTELLSRTAMEIENIHFLLDILDVAALAVTKLRFGHLRIDALRIGIEGADFASLGIPVSIELDNGISLPLLASVDLEKLRGTTEEEVRAAIVAIPYVHTTFEQIIDSLEALASGRRSPFSLAGLSYTLGVPTIVRNAGKYTHIYLPTGSEPVAQFISSLQSKGLNPDKVSIQIQNDKLVLCLDRNMLLEQGIVYKGTKTGIPVLFPPSQLIMPLQVRGSDGETKVFTFQVGLSTELVETDIDRLIGAIIATQGWLLVDIHEKLSAGGLTIQEEVKSWYDDLLGIMIHELSQHVTATRWVPIVFQMLVNLVDDPATLELSTNEILSRIRESIIKNLRGSALEHIPGATKILDDIIRLKRITTNVGEISTYPVQKTVDSTLGEVRRYLRDVPNSDRITIEDIDLSGLTGEQYDHLDIIDIGMLRYFVLNTIRNAIISNRNQLADDPNFRLRIKLVIHQEGDIMQVWTLDNGIGMIAADGESVQARIESIKRGEPVISTGGGTGRALAVLASSARHVETAAQVLGLKGNYSLQIGNRICPLRGYEEYTGFHIEHCWVILKTAQEKIV
jgi:hypothetical protein